MKVPLILLHEESLRMKHNVFKVAPSGTKAIYIWDNCYFEQANYSLKRLIFIYETLCELPIEIIRGNTLDIVREFAPSDLYMPATNNPLITEIINDLKSYLPVQVVEDEHFVNISNSTHFMRFFKYWNKAEKSAFKNNGD